MFDRGRLADLTRRQRATYRGRNPRSAAASTSTSPNRDVLMTPFHNMALMCPQTTAAQVDLHEQVFAAAVAELLAA